MIKRLLNSLFFSLMLPICNNIGKHYGFSFQPIGLDYIDAIATTESARKAGLTVHDWLKRHDSDHKKGRTDRIVSEINKLMKGCDLPVIVEIGAGTGMYMERILPLVNASRYHVFETNIGWQNYLRKTFENSAICHTYNCDGKTLKEVASSTVDLVHAHAVFVYTPILITLPYIIEASRVLKVGGKLCFDCFIDATFDDDQINKWRKSEHVFPVIISKDILDRQIAHIGLKFHSCFHEVYGPGFVEYVVYERI